jgi:hypothetical protein
MTKAIPMNTRSEILLALESDDPDIRAAAHKAFDILEAAQGPVREAMRRYAMNPTPPKPSSAPSAMEERLMRQMTGRAGATTFMPSVML